MSESMVHSHLTVNHSYSQSFNQKLASICCLALREIDDQLYSQIMLLLSTLAFFSLSPGSSFKNYNYFGSNIRFYSSSLHFLDRFFLRISADMVVHLRHFVTSPLPLFEFGFSSEARTFPPISLLPRNVIGINDITDKTGNTQIDLLGKIEQGDQPGHCKSQH